MLPLLIFVWTGGSIVAIHRITELYIFYQEEEKHPKEIIKHYPW